MKRAAVLLIAVCAFATGYLLGQTARPIVIHVVQVEDADAFDPDPTVHPI